MRKGKCKNCGSDIFRPIGRSYWVHVDPRWYRCYVQQAIDYAPYAEIG